MNFVCSRKWFVPALLAVLTFPTFGVADDLIPTNLDAASASEYMGLWKLNMELLDDPFTLYLDMAEVDGMAAAVVDSELQAKPLHIEAIEQVDGGDLLLEAQLLFQGRVTLNIALDIAMQDGVPVGMLREKSGIFKSEFLGEPATREEIEALDDLRPLPTEARLRLDDGTEIRIMFPDLAHGTPDWDRIKHLEDGEVFTFSQGSAMKLYTDHDLQFGDTIVKAENVAPDYPGVYSMWLRRVGDGWTMVFNEQPDIWGTRYREEHDVAEVPLRQMATTGGGPDDAPFLVLLGPGGKDGGTIRMGWGDLAWNTRFKILR